MNNTHDNNRVQCPFFSGSTTRTQELNVRIERLAPACRCQGSPTATFPSAIRNPAGRREGAALPSAPLRHKGRPAPGARVPSAELPSRSLPGPNGGRSPTARRGMASPCRGPSPLRSPSPHLLPRKPRRAPPIPSRAPHLLLALAAEAQARGPLLVAVAVVGAGLVRLELHHPPGPGGGFRAGPRSPGRGSLLRVGGRPRARVQARSRGREEGLCVRYTAPRWDGLIVPGPGPAPPSRPPSPPPPPPLPPPPPTTTAPPSWTRCVSCVGHAGSPDGRACAAQTAFGNKGIAPGAGDRLH